jgi:hypothetical protein
MTRIPSEIHPIFWYSESFLTFSSYFRPCFRAPLPSKPLRNRGERHMVRPPETRGSDSEKEGVGDPQNWVLVAHPCFRFSFSDFCLTGRAKPPPNKSASHDKHFSR